MRWRAGGYIFRKSKSEKYSSLKRKRTRTTRRCNFAPTHGQESLRVPAGSTGRSPITAGLLRAGAGGHLARPGTASASPLAGGQMLSLRVPPAPEPAIHRERFCQPGARHSLARNSRDGKRPGSLCREQVTLAPTVTRGHSHQY